jgi:predicted ATPase
MPDGLGPDHFLVHLELLRDQVPSFDSYPFSLPAVRALDTLPLHPKVTFFVGDNGTGKSTLMEAIAVGLGLNAEGGSRNFNFSTRPSHSQLCDFLRLRRGSKHCKDSWFLRAESFFNVATEIESLGVGPFYGDRPLHEQSHGESFLSVFQNRFRGEGLYLLDEPEAALSPMRQMSFLSILHEQVRAGAQFIIATHSPIIMAYPDSWIYVFGGSEIKRVAYKETEHYKMTRDFLSKPDRMLSILLADEPTLFDAHHEQSTS